LIRSKEIPPRPVHDRTKGQVFFPIDLMKVFLWLIRLRWMAVAGGLIASWVVYTEDRAFPTLVVQGTLVVISGYNLIFYLLRRRMSAAAPLDERSVILVAHAQTAVDLLALFLLIGFTGGIYSPLLIFVFFPIVLIGIIFSPVGCFIYGTLVVMATGGLILMGEMDILPPPIAMVQNSLFGDRFGLIPYVCFVGAILATGVLVTATASRLRGKGSDLFRISRELDASNTKLAALYEMVKEMGLCSDLQKLMDTATRHATRIMGVKGCAIKLMDEEAKTLRFTSTYGLSQDYLAKGKIDIDKSPINRQIIEGAVCAIGSIDEKDYFQYPEDIRKEGIASMICLPLRVEKKIFGIFCVYSDESYCFGESDTKFFSLMTDLAAIAIENLRSGLLKLWFMMKVSHQLRSPMNAVYTMLKPMSGEYLGPLSVAQKDTLDKCLKRIKNLGELINDLLKLGEKKSEVAAPVWYPVDLVKIMRHMQDFYQTQARQKTIDFRVQIAADLPKVHANEKLIDELFTNLISNAIKYTPANGRVEVSLTRATNDRVCLEVSDTGIGVSEKDLPGLFAEFFRTDNAKAFTEEGTGLGLSIVKEILDRIGGTVHVESTLGQGSRFSCLLPNAPNPQPAPGAPSAG
jgi:two-component sensor histidine kinase/putative methionine-R-sulfoxide reductase with GAF domain